MNLDRTGSEILPSWCPGFNNFCVMGVRLCKPGEGLNLKSLFFTSSVKVCSCSCGSIRQYYSFLLTELTKESGYLFDFEFYDTTCGSDNL